MSRIEFIKGQTFHGRKGDVRNAFRYSIDYVLLDAEIAPDAPFLFGRNSAGLASVKDRDHGGAPGQGQGAKWAREVLDAHGIAADRIELLTQPRILGYVFNPVSFWLCRDADGGLRAVIAEVTNTFGDRHSYLCRRDDGDCITAQDTLRATKIFHVSPFQPISGGYAFRFDIRPDKIGIWIDFTTEHGGVLATLIGARQPLRNRDILWSAIRRPFGARRVMALIHWQALKLFFKGARYRTRPIPPAQDVS